MTNLTILRDLTYQQRFTEAYRTYYSIPNSLALSYIKAHSKNIKPQRKSFWLDQGKGYSFSYYGGAGYGWDGGGGIGFRANYLKEYNLEYLSFSYTYWRNWNSYRLWVKR